jgi:hypothetical protein
MVVVAVAVVLLLGFYRGGYCVGGNCWNIGAGCCALVANSSQSLGRRNIQA